LKTNIDDDNLLCTDHLKAKTTSSLMLDISKMLEDQIAKRSASLKLPSGARRVLFYLSVKDGCTQLDLIRATHLKAPTISLIVQKMEQDDLVSRKTDDVDMRLIRVYLTDKGRSIYKSLLNVTEEIEREFFSALDETEKEVLHSLLSRIYG